MPSRFYFVTLLDLFDETDDSRFRLIGPEAIMV